MVDEAEIKRRKNNLRFKWHEKILADPKVRKRPNSVILAGHMMHRFDVDKGYAEFSLNDVVRALGMPRCTVLRSRDFLVERGWIQIFQRPRGPAGRHLTLRYSFAFGPDDLLLDEHQPSSSGDT